MTPQSNDGERTPRRDSPAWLGWLMPVGFGILAIALLAGSRESNIPVPPVTIVDRTSLQPGPRRIPMTDPAHILIDGTPQNCNGCHQIFHSDSDAGAVLSYHQDVDLRHGMNNRCVNCHDVENRERLTLRDGATVPFSETPSLCAQCHGTVYRDWQRGTHGKTLGSWITGSDLQRRLSCNECHNPHSPRFEKYKPLPGPNTLRMGEPHASQSHESSGKRSPLQRWLEHPSDAHPQDPIHDGGHP